MSNPSSSSCTHVREHRSLLAAPEKRVLVWLAGRLPSVINSDHLSALGLGSMFAAGLSFALFRFTPWAAAGVLLSLTANWFGDSLDGTLARVRGHQRPRYGYYVDHVIDLAGTAVLLIGLACSGLMHPLLAMALLAAYLLVSAETYLATHAAGTFRMSFAGVGPTELRIILAIGAVKAAIDPTVGFIFLDSIKLFDLGGLIALKGLAIAFMWSALRNTRMLYRAEPLRARADEAPADEAPVPMLARAAFALRASARQGVKGLSRRSSPWMRASEGGGPGASGKDVV